MKQRLTALRASFKSAGKAAVISALTVTLAACSATIEERGYIVDESDFERVQAGTTTEAQIEEILGSPSTVATVDGKVWYYISSTFEKLMFYEPEEIDRTVVAVYFDENNIVQELAYYGLEDGRIINFRTRKTPTRGKELTVLGQIFGNLGRFNQNQPATPNRPGR